jgi:Ca2+-binding RTX toxin-like protein
LTVADSTIVDNSSRGGQFLDSFEGAFGGGVRLFDGWLTLRNSTVTGNYAETSFGYVGSGGGIHVTTSTVVDIANSIVAGNIAADSADISGTVDVSNGHNVFGSDIIGNIAGDREGISTGTLFSTGDVTADGAVALRNSASNPALSGALSFDSLGTDQLGHARPQPSTSSPDIGAAELNQTLSTQPSNNNDTLTGTGGINTISGGLGNDRIVGLAGNDTLNGNDGGDTFDGGTGVDIALYSGTTALVFDLSGTADKVTQGSAVDTLTGIEGGSGSSGPDTFKGDAASNFFRGGDGKDTATGGGGRDTYYLTSAQNSPAMSTGRDVVTDFVHGQDKIDLARIDPDGGRAGDQAFHWLGHVALGTTPGDLSWFSSGGNTIVQGSTDTDSAAEFWIQLNGNIGASLAATDFVL